MTSPPTTPSASVSSPPDTPPHGAPADPNGERLGWLLDNFLAQVPGTQAAFLASRDGLNMAATGLSEEQADHAAALSASLYSTSRAAGAITDPEGGEVQQVAVQLDRRLMFVMSAQDQAARAGSGPGAVGCVLGVLADPDAHTRLVGDEMAALITSVAEHLVTATRTSHAATSGAGDER